MPLSEQEQRLLDEMERSLYHNDADDVTTVGGRRGRAGGAAILIGVLGLVVGLVLLLVGVMVRVPVVGVVGFVAMFAGALVLIAPPRRLTISQHRDPSAPRAPRPSFMDSLGERWERRNEGDDH
jgi:tetrahydromethanopterin S-methyltransferase subunit G